MKELKAELRYLKGQKERGYKSVGIAMVNIDDRIKEIEMELNLKNK